MNEILETKFYNMENFDNTFNSLFNIGDALKQIQDNVANISATGEAGAGDIKAIVNGKRATFSSLFILFRRKFKEV